MTDSVLRGQLALAIVAVAVACGDRSATAHAPVSTDAGLCGAGENDCGQDPSLIEDAGHPPRDAGWIDMPGEWPDGGRLDGAELPASSLVHHLDYFVVDADYSRSLASIVIASDTPDNAVHIYDVRTGIDRALALTARPLKVAVDPAGQRAAVALDGYVADVDLAAGVVRATCSGIRAPSDIALSPQGLAAVVGGRDGIMLLTLGGCDAEDVGLEDAYFFGPGYVAFHPDGTTLFAAGQGTSPSSFLRCAGPTCGRADWGFPYRHDRYEELWFNADGTRLFTGSGLVVQIPETVTTGDCREFGTIDSDIPFRSFSEATVAGSVVMIATKRPFYASDDPNRDLVVRVYDAASLELQHMYQLPLFPTGRAEVPAHGLFVFTTPSMDEIDVVVQADAVGRALHPYGIVRLHPE